MEMKVRSIKVGEEQWERWAVEAAALGLDRSAYIRNAVDGAIGEDGAALRQAQDVVDAQVEEISHLKRELAGRPVGKKVTLPGLSGAGRFVCGECGALNVRGRCASHPNAKQKKLAGS